MIDFCLEDCPLCGGEAMVASLTQGPEILNAVIKCTGCGLTLEWETEIKVGISRSGKRTTVKAGLDPIEAWNKRALCDKCSDRCLAARMSELHDCNDCERENCEYKPAPGLPTRINCPMWLPF